MDDRSRSPSSRFWDAQQIGLKGSLRFWKPDNRQVRFLHLLPHPRVYSPDSRGIGSVVQREDTRFAPEECRFKSDQNPPFAPRDSSRAWIVHPAGLDTVSNTVGALPPGVRVPRYPPYQGPMGLTTRSGQLPGRQHRLEIGWHGNVFGSVPSHSANVRGPIWNVYLSGTGTVC